MSAVIRFLVPEDGSLVSVAGSFNGWQPEAMKLSDDGTVYEREITSKNGVSETHMYKFVLNNGDWVLQDGQTTTPDENGVLNHKIQVTGTSLSNVLDQALSPDPTDKDRTDHLPTPESAQIPKDIGTEVINEQVANNAYDAEPASTSSSGPGLVDADERKSRSAASHNDSHLNPAAPVFNPIAQPFVPASNPPKSSQPASRASNRQRSQSRHNRSHSRSNSVASSRARSGSNLHHEELNPAAHEFKPQFAQPTHHVPHASGYAAALKKPASPPIKEETFKKPHLPNKAPVSQAVPATGVRSEDVRSTSQDSKPETNHATSYAEMAKHAAVQNRSNEVSQTPNGSTISDAVASTATTSQLSSAAEKSQDPSDRTKSTLDHPALASPMQSSQAESDATVENVPSTKEVFTDQVANGSGSVKEVVAESLKSMEDSASSTVESAKRKIPEVPEKLANAVKPVQANIENAIDTVVHAAKGAASPEGLENPKEHDIKKDNLETIDLSKEDYDPEQIRLMEEVCILLDRDDSPIGSASKKDAHLMSNIMEGVLHRAFSLFIFNSEDKLLLQQRATEKITFPDMWTNTCCSHPLHVTGEVAEDLPGSIMGVKRAAQRKVKQELGISAQNAPIDQMTFLTRIHYLAPSDGQWGEHEIDYILFLKSDPFLEINPNEVRDYKWVSQSELRELFKSAELNYTPWFKLICETFLFDWWNKLSSLNECKDEQTIHRLGLEPGVFQKIQHSGSSSTLAQITSSTNEAATEFVESAKSLASATQGKAADAANAVSESVNAIAEGISNTSEKIYEQITSAGQSEQSTFDDLERSEPAAEDTLPIANTPAPKFESASAVAQGESTEPSTTSKDVAETSEPAAEDAQIPVAVEVNPVEAEVQGSFNATENDATSAASSSKPADAVLELSPQGESRIAAQSIPASEEVSRPGTGKSNKSIRAKQNFFFYIFQSLFGGIFKGFSRFFDKLAFWRKSPQSQTD